MEPKPIILSRTEWEAEPPRPTIEEQRYQEPLEEVLDHLVIHHSGMPPSYAPQSLQYFSWRMGFDDIPYHYYILNDGTIYEGRSLEYIGAHAGMTKESVARGDLSLDPDYGSIGIALAGCFDISCRENHHVTMAQLASLESLLVYLMNQFSKIEPATILLHHEVDAKWSEARGLTPAHEQNTQCPGKDLIPHLEYLRGHLRKRHPDESRDP